MLDCVGPYQGDVCRRATRSTFEFGRLNQLGIDAFFNDARRIGVGAGGNKEAGNGGGRQSTMTDKGKPLDCPAITGGVQVAAASVFGSNGSADIFVDFFNGSIGTTVGIGPSGGVGGFITVGAGITSRNQLDGIGRDFSGVVGFGLARGITVGSRGGLRLGFGAGAVLNVTRNSSLGGAFDFPGLTDIPFVGEVIAIVFCADPS